MLTIAEAWEQKGRAEGRVEGRAEGRVAGRRETVQRLLTKKFGPLPETIVARLEEATEEDLADYVDLLLDAVRLDDVFES